MNESAATYYIAARERVAQVVAWCERRITEERQKPEPDVHLLEDLAWVRNVAVADRVDLADVGEARVREMHRTYGELYLRLVTEERAAQRA